MPYTAGTQAADTNPALVYMTYLDTALLAAGFTFVEQQVATNTTRVYKSAAASNVANIDWYLLVRRTADTSTTVQFTCCELYNSSTHLCRYYIIDGGLPDANGGVTDLTGQSPNYTSLKMRSVSISAAGFTYVSSITTNRLVIGTRISSSNYAAYCGLYDDLYLSSSFPALMVSAIDSGLGGTNNGGTTRELGTGASGSNFVIDTGITGYTPIFANNAYIGGATTLARSYVRGARGPKGLMKDLWLGQTYNANGDTLPATINGISKTLAQIMGTNAGLAPYVDTAL